MVQNFYIMGKRTEVPTVNAGSMADIAFLLLIFFLVTTSIETDAGLDRMLPRIDTTPPIEIKDRNILLVSINKHNQLLVEEKEMVLGDLKKTTVTFLDNGGVEESCGYCRGGRLPNSSEDPIRAVVLLKSDRETTYATYISVQNELVAAYNLLRNRESQRRYQQDYTAMELAYQDPKTSPSYKEILKTKIKRIQALYPLNIIEPL